MERELDKKNILIIFLSGIGNCISFIPALKAISNKYPNAIITLLTKQKTVSEIVKMAEIDNSVTSVVMSGSFMKRILTGLSLIYKLRKKYDLVITTFEAQGWKLAFFVKAIRGKLTIGYKTGRWYDCLYSKTLVFDRNSHEVDRHFMIADFLGATVNEKKCEIHIGPEDQQCANSIMAENGIIDQKLVVGIHPGSSEYLFRKRWAPERFAQVIDCLSEKYAAQIIIFGGPHEVSLAEKIARLTVKAEPIVLVGKTKIRQTAAMIDKCDLFVTNDSGLMHVAAAVNTPTVAIFGPTNPSKNAPAGDGHVVVRREMPCSPCINYVEDKCSDPKCLEAVTVDNVLAAIDKQLYFMDIVKQ